MSQKLGHYQIEDLLGEGNFAWVYRALDQKLERLVALKILKPAWLNDPSALRRFGREAKAMANLHHPHIVQIYDVGEAEGQVYLAEFLVEGESLAARLKRGPLPWAEMLDILGQIATALDYAHSKSVIHRDIKPANILLGEGQQVYLSDFGLVGAAEGSASLSASAGGLVGTPAYMAPEQWGEEKATAAIDVYALSCVVVEMLTGQVLFEGPTPAVVAKHLIDGPEFPAEWPVDVPKGLTEVLQRGLARVAAERIGSAGELAAELKALTALPQPNRPSHRPETPPTPPPSEPVEAKEGQPAPIGPSLAAPSPAPTPITQPPPKRRSSGCGLISGAVALVGIGLVLLVAAITFYFGRGGAAATPEPPLFIEEEAAPLEEEAAADEVQEPPEAKPTVQRYGQVTDVGGIDDGGFNQLAWAGMQQASEELGVEVQFLESQQQTDYEKNIAEFVDQGYDGIITVGFLLADATKAASVANPDVPIAIVDFPSQTSGDMGLLFVVSEPSFMTGYLAAGMSQTGIVCTYGGLKIPPVTEFMVSFEQGVLHYNKQKGADVQVLGWQTDAAAEGGGDGSFTGNFENPDDGRSFAANFFDEGCDIIFPVTGPAAGLGSAAVAQDRGRIVIGVDSDLTQTNPDAADVYLTSVVKQIDVAVFEAVKHMAEGTFESGTNFIGTLENGGVGLAPFYDFENDVPPALKDELATIRRGIIDGSIYTGWPIVQTVPAEPAEAEEVRLVMSSVPVGVTEEPLTAGTRLSEMIAARTGYDVEFSLATTYDDVLEAMCAEKADIGWLNTFGYILANERCGIEVALATVRFGTTSFKGQIITRTDSGIESLADLPGVTFCRPDPLSTSGWLIPSITLAANGIDPEADITVIDVGSHNSVVTAVYNGECDAGSTFVDARSSVENDIPDVRNQVIVIAESADIPNTTISFASTVPDNVRQNVVVALLDIAQSEEGAAVLNDLYTIAGLDPVDDSFYDSLRYDLDASGYSIEDFQ